MWACERCGSLAHLACIGRVPAALYHCHQCKKEHDQGKFKDPTFDFNLWEYVVSGMHRDSEVVERSRVEQQALQCCVHGGELMVMHDGGWKVLPSMQRR